ncbi:hypothetical protein JTE90_005342 [Oedothorax gibbosus]|uniref:Uncharacterized protein n=1 Tax=Oedothorax gibbosus TaxID=931172 RepID=A0AAV6TLD6_9ARAC|nr:hypothetical protein JTE90_005342 [Oedothorax gibbosus]
MSFNGVIVGGLLLLCVYYTEAKITQTTTNHHLNPKATAIHLGLLHPTRTKVGANATKACRHSTAVESFVASFYTYFIVTNDPIVVKRLKLRATRLPRAEATGQKILADGHHCDADYIAEEVASTSAEQGHCSWRNITSSRYGIGDFLYLSGILNCKNAIQLAREFFAYVEKAFGENDSYDSYMQGIVYGLSDFLIAHQDVLKEVTLELADQFFKEFSDGNAGTCEAPASGAAPAAGKEL